MSKRRKLSKEKEPAELAAQVGSGCDSADSLVNNNSSTNADKSQYDGESGRHFWFVVWPSESYVKTNYPNCTYDGSDGWGTAPENWIELLQNTGLAFCVSPFHDRDINPTGTPKKPHWHVIVSWGNSTTYNAAKGLCKMLNCPRPELLRNVEGAYRYHKHLDNPEKFQYTENSKSYGGWTLPLDGKAKLRIKQELKELIFREDIQEYAELLIVCDGLGAEYFDVAANNTFYCERLVASYRHNPVRVLMRFYNELPDGELKDEIWTRIVRYKADESKN